MKLLRALIENPRTVRVLFFTELWERFSYYGMRALFTLFLVAKTDSENPGFGWTNSEAIALYGWYTMLVYLASLPGGWIADKIQCQRRSHRAVSTMAAASPKASSASCLFKF